MITKKHPYTYRSCDANMIADLLMQGITQTQHYSQAQGYLLSGEIPTVLAIHEAVQACTQTLRKQLIKRTEQLHQKINLRIANRFLHLICVRLLSYGPDAQAAHLAISEKELAIRLARQAWVQARAQAEVLRLGYVAEKGDFYKRLR